MSTFWAIFYVIGAVLVWSNLVTYPTPIATAYRLKHPMGAVLINLSVALSWPLIGLYIVVMGLTDMLISHWRK
jgi:hypothetical protein